MLVSTEISSWRKIGSDEKAIKLLKDSGFTAYDYSMSKSLDPTLNIGFELISSDNYIEKAKKLREYADSVGLRCNQTHGPFPTAKTGDDKYNKWATEMSKRAIEVSGILGAKICVVHPWNYYTPEQNVELYRPLVETAKKAGVKIATENMWNAVNYGTKEQIVYSAACSSHSNFKKQMELLVELDKDVFCACVDIGHAEMKGLDTSAVKMLETLGRYVECMHLHDVDLLHDNHQLPFNCNIDYAPVIEAYKKIGYKGDVTLECNTFAGKLPVELLPAGAKYAAAVANYFKEKIEN